MNNKIKVITILTIVFGIFITSVNLNANIKENPKKKKEQIQRTPTQTFDLQKNTVSNFQFPVTNYGILFLDVAQNRGGGYWPRGSLNQYFFGGGIWFAAQKWVMRDTITRDAEGNPIDTVSKKTLVKLCEISYNPNSGLSWMVPGSIDDGDEIDNTDIKKYRNYFSTDFRTNDGVPFDENDGPNWPLWDTQDSDTLKQDRYFGKYIQDENERDLAVYPKGPAFISGEDIFATFKDTDLNYYEGGAESRRDQGYPFRLQFEQTIYSWGYGDYRDFIFVKYEIQNRSQDTLWNCWLAPIMDVDIARAPNTTAGAGNDFARYYDEDPDLNLAFQWTRDDPMEKGYGFGYLGFDFLESPSIYQGESRFDTTINGKTQSWFRMCLEKDTIKVRVTDTTFKDSIVCINGISFPEEYNGFPRNDRKWYPNSQQLGLKTFHRWPIAEDINDDDARYNNLSSGNIELGEGEAGDYRFLMSTGPFNFRPHDTVRTVIGIILANPALFPDADGSVTEDVAELVRKDKFAQRVYDNNFQAPAPPEKSHITWHPLNNGVEIQWDSTSEMSLDKYERGLDFMGFTLYRARRTDLDTFDVDEISASNAYPSGKGPMGWKQIATWQLPTPFYKSYNRAGKVPDDENMPMIDSIGIVGPVYERDKAGVLKVDTFAIKVMRVAKGLLIFGPDTFVKNNMKTVTQYYGRRIWNHTNTLNQFIYSVDTALISKPWGKYFASLTTTNDFPLWYDPYNPDDPKNDNPLLHDVLIGTIHLNRALLDFNPLFWKRVTVQVDPADTVDFPDGVDTLTQIKYLKDTYRTLTIDGSEKLLMDQLQPVIINDAMKDTVLVQKALDSIYSYIQKGYATVDFPDFENSLDAKEKCIIPYMNEITNNRTFVDIGDDNHSGDVNFELSPTKTEKLINNVPYFYKLLAFDEGDFSQPTPKKLNAGFLKLPNVLTAYPRAASIAKPVNFKITFVDSSRIGGLYNFKLFAIDPDRVRQLFSGHDLELSFEPSWFASSFTRSKTVGETVETRTVPYTLYRSNMKLIDKSNNDKLLYEGWTYLEQNMGHVPLAGAFTENAQSWVVDYEPIEDSISHKMINLPITDNDSVITRTATISTGDFSQSRYFYTFGMREPAYGTLGFSFDYTAQQRGGVYRPDSSSLYPPVNGRPSPILKGNATVPINFLTDLPDVTDSFGSSVVYRGQVVDLQVTGNRLITDSARLSWGISPQYGNSVYGSFNNGPAEYLVTFKAGGKDTLKLHSDNMKLPADFICDYLLMDVKNVISFKRPSQKGDSVIVDYPLPIEHLKIDTGNGYKYPQLLNLKSNFNDFIGKYNLSAYGYIDGTGQKSYFKYKGLKAFPSDFNVTAQTIGQIFSIGKQGRYYKTGTSVDGQHKINFANIFLASGVQFAFDYARNLSRGGATPDWKLSKEVQSTTPVDFAPGDQILLKTNGGALGFPMPGAKVLIHIDSSFVPESQLTDKDMEDVRVVPNPYYITHQGQASPYDAKIYFTKLPKHCTIDIYTVTGDLVRSMEHDEYTSSEPDKMGVEIWNLLSKNRQRVQSQSFIAVIKTPEGSQSIKQFSVVVGGFRLVPEEK